MFLHILYIAILFSQPGTEITLKNIKITIIIIIFTINDYPVILLLDLCDVRTLLVNLADVSACLGFLFFKREIRIIILHNSYNNTA